MPDNVAPEKTVAPTSSEAPKDDRPAVLIVGGLGELLTNPSHFSSVLMSNAGYIGRFLALYLHQNKLACSIRLVDKVLPQLARLAPEFSEACSPANFVQADASRERVILLQSYT